MLRPVRIVQIQQRRLRQRIRPALHIRVLRIPVHLNRPIRIALHQHRYCARRKRKRRRKVHRLAQNQIFRRAHVRHNRLIRLLRAPGQPRQRHRRAHHLQKTPPRNRVDPLRSLRRKFLRHHLRELRRLRQLIHRPPELFPLLMRELRPHLSQSDRLLRFDLHQSVTAYGSSHRQHANLALRLCVRA